MSKTSRLGLPYIIQSQAQKEVTHNQALNKLDVYVNPVVEAIVSELPTEAKEGSVYIMNDEIVEFSLGNWNYHPVLEYMEIWIKSEKTKMIFSDGKWINLYSLPNENSKKDIKNK